MRWDEMAYPYHTEVLDRVVHSSTKKAHLGSVQVVHSTYWLSSTQVRWYCSGEINGSISENSSSFV